MKEVKHDQGKIGNELLEKTIRIQKDKITKTAKALDIALATLGLVERCSSPMETRKQAKAGRKLIAQALAGTI